MKKIYSTLTVAALAMGAALTGCSDEQGLTSGQGQITLATKVSSDIKVNANSRADLTDELGEKLIVWISNPKGVVRKYNGIGEVPTGPIQLLSDHYVAEAWTGDSVSASFTDKWYKAREEFDITSGCDVNVTLNCKIANTVASVTYSDEVQTLLSDMKMTVGHKRGDLTFEGTTDQKGYFMMPSNDKDLHWNFEATQVNGTLYTRSGVIENAKPATEYVINFVIKEGQGEDIGGAYLDVVVDERTIDVEDEFVIKLGPNIQGYGFDINNTVYGEKGNIGRRSVTAKCNGTFSALTMRSSVLTPIVGGEDIDLINMTGAYTGRLSAAGITYSSGYDAEQDASWFKVNFEEALLNSLDDGAYAFDFSATDSQGKTSVKTLAIEITNAPVQPEAVNNLDTWATKATLKGSILKAPANDLGFMYRKQGETGWQTVAATANGNTFSAEISGLTPGTVYEYKAISTDFTSAKTLTFTTEAAAQLPNASFENWNTSSTPYLVYKSGESMWWDSGNHGSATMSKNITTPATDYVHSGTYSAKLASQFVGVGAIGKFAAGNIFAGEYLATEGTDGVLGWGRPFTSRPKALRGWVHYTPVAITHSSVSEAPKGDMDKGIIYIAIVDGSTKDYSGKSYPVIVKTKSSDRSLFSKEDANVIAYGEKVFTEATSGSAMVQFEIPLDYVRTDIKAANIVIVCSASKYGDYFTGGNGSTMYIDDFELVY